MEHKALTAIDRCDRCGAQAYARTVHDGFPLLWCAHHLKVHRPSLVPHLVTDETHLLQPKAPEPVS